MAMGYLLYMFLYMCNMEDFSWLLSFAGHTNFEKERIQQYKELSGIHVLADALVISTVFLFLISEANLRHCFVFILRQDLTIQTRLPWNLYVVQTYLVPVPRCNIWGSISVLDHFSKILKPGFDAQNSQKGQKVEEKEERRDRLHLIWGRFPPDSSCVCLCIWRPETDTGCLPRLLSTLSLGTGLLLQQELTNFARFTHQ